MRRLWITVLLMICLPVLALAEEMPPEVRALMNEYYGAQYPDEYVSVSLPDGRQAGIVITEGSSVQGFIRRDGVWQRATDTFAMDVMRPVHPESVPGDASAFAIVSQDGASRLVYRFTGEDFRLISWALPKAPPVRVDGERLTYHMDGEAVEIILPGGLPDHWPWDMEDLPLTPERAELLADITESRVADLYPGYTLRSYSSYNTGTGADAAYSRMKDGLLFIRRVSFEAGYAPRVLDCPPVPLSGKLIDRLETEPFDLLISCMSGSDTFLTQDAFDRGSLALPADAVILNNQVQSQSVIALVEEGAARYLYVWEIAAAAGVNGDGYHARRTQPLPEGTYLDLFHASDGEVQLEWGAQARTATFSRSADGQWRLQWFGDHEQGEFLSACAFGLWTQPDGARQRLCVGTMTGRDLFSVRLDTLDATRMPIDRTGWAVVNNPDPADRLHLRTEPSRSSRSQGKLYNGTPLLVLDSHNGWTKVQLGLGGTALTGWMMTEYLAFGDAMDEVHDAWPELVFREEFRSGDRLNDYRVVGLENAQYILLDMEGEVMLVPQEWLFEGNG